MGGRCDIDGVSKMVVEEVAELSVVGMPKAHEVHLRITGWAKKGVRAKGVEKELNEALTRHHAVAVRRNRWLRGF